MWKKLGITSLSPSKLLLWLLVLLLLLLTAWQGLQVAKLGYVWQTLPQRTLATPLVDYVEQTAVRAILADDTIQAQRLVTELTATKLISSAQLYGDDGHLLAAAVATSAPTAIEPPTPTLDVKEAGTPTDNPDQPLALPTKAELTYVRPLYQDEQPLGFLRLQLTGNPLSVAQHSLWRQLEHHLSWLFPLCLMCGLLLGMGLQHWRQRRAPNVS